MHTTAANITGKTAARNWSRPLEAALWVFSGASFALLAGAAGVAALAHQQALAIHAQAIPAQSSPATSTNNLSHPPAAQVIGRIEIPALHLSVPVTSGVETSSLLAGVGYINGTALPGGLGTTVLAGHRDTYLRPLEHIAKGMEIRLTASTGTYRYTVDRWEVVLPEDVDAVSTQSRPELALVTCYPFHFIGPAPKRFIVHAHLDSLIPEAKSETGN